MIVTLSPFGAIDIISITFSPLPIFTVVEKLPLAAGVITSSEEAVITVITALVEVFPDKAKTLLLTTSSSFGLSIVKNIEGIGVRVGETILTVFVFEGAIVFVA